jgi:hypothetical protein
MEGFIMIKKISFTIVFLCMLNTMAFSENYAILVSAGKATTDDLFNNSEFWYDLILAYEDLINNQNYTHDNIFVFYGDGNDWTGSSYNKYKPSHYGWSSIVDFDNKWSTIRDTIKNYISPKISNNDNLHIRWVVGHGFPGNNTDDYYANWQNRTPNIEDTVIINAFDKINNYTRRKIIWMTCHSGCLAKGNENFNNSKTTIIASSDYDEPSYPYCPYCGSDGTCSCSTDDDVHAELNWVVTSSLSGSDPLGNSYNGDHNNDEVISMQDLYDEANSSIIMDSDPQIGDNGSIANKIFINENLVLEDVDLSNTYEYWVENITVRDFSILNSGNVTFEPEVEIIIEKNFETKVGGELEIK